MSKNMTANWADNLAKHGCCPRICTDLIDNDNCNLEIFGKFSELKKVSIQSLSTLPSRLAIRATRWTAESRSQ